MALSTQSLRHDELVDQLGELHREVDALTSQVTAKHAGRLGCRRGCAGCCQDDLSVLAIEAARIRAYHATLLEQARPHCPGACAFLDGEGACRIYEQRPYVCRTQGLPLRWFEQDADSWGRELRDVCPLNLRGVDLDALSEDAVWLIGPFEIRLASLQAEFGGEQVQRVPLRSLFRATAPCRLRG
jgi:hypothetical protein